MSGTKVQVAVRARPLSQREIDMKSAVVLEMKGKSTFMRKTTDGLLIGQTRDRVNEFVYDYSYWSLDSTAANYTSQEQVFNNLGKSVLEAAFEGYNACVFAYGQTGSGKTFTMMGTETAPGLIPRICENLFDRTASGSLRKVSYKIEASFMEIYNEMVRDLLMPVSQRNITHGLKVRQHPKHGPYVENLTKHPVVDYQHIEELMNLGNSNRVTACTKMNDTSSRSHAIFTITFTQATYSADLPCETVSKINLVDLAGSERASATGAEGIRLKEGGNINRSLVCLGNVISALAERSSHPTAQRYIPYRDSVLTWLLKDSLGGNSKTIMIATVSPAECNYGETLSTLRYATRAKNIVNKPVVNEDPNVRLIRELRAEIKRLKRIIEEGHLNSDQTGSTQTVTEMFSEDIQRKESQIAELTKTWAGKWDGIQSVLEDSNLALRSEGIKMTVAAEQPHFLAVDDDALGTGVVIYRLQGETTTIGAAGSTPKPDIELNGLDIEAEHCLAEYVDDKVYLTPLSGTTIINNSTATCQTKLTHGDIVQLGSTCVFRFNHPREAEEMKHCSDELHGKGRLLELSPLSVRDRMEEQRLALEQRYEEKLESMRKEMETRNELEKAKLQMELDKLRFSPPVAIPTVTMGEEELELGSPVAENDPYNIMKSIAFEPVVHKKRTKSFNIMDITGGRQVRQPNDPYNVVESVRSINRAKTLGGRHIPEPIDSKEPQHFSHSPSPQFEPHLPLLSPATGQHNTAVLTNEGSPISSEMEKLLDTYEVIPKGGENSALSPTHPVDVTDGSSGGCTFDIGYVSRNMSKFKVDNGLNENCPSQTVEPAVSTTDHPDSDLPHEQPKDEGLSAAERLLDGDEGLGEEGEKVGGVIMRKRKGDTYNVRKLAQKLTKDVEQLKKEKEEYSIENKELKQKLVQLGSPQMTDKESDLDYRRRSYAQSENDLKPVVGRLRRSHSLGSRRVRLNFSIDRHFLRGKGLTSYHMYEVSTALGNEKWVVHRRYQDFQKLHDEMRRRYPQLSSLSLPPSKWFGHKNESFVKQRRQQLQDYMQSLVAVLGHLPNSPLLETPGKKISKEDLILMSGFFDDGGPVYGTVS